MGLHEDVRHSSSTSSMRIIPAGGLGSSVSLRSLSRSLNSSGETYPGVPGTLFREEGCHIPPPAPSVGGTGASAEGFGATAAVAFALGPEGFGATLPPAFAFACASVK